MYLPLGNKNCRFFFPEKVRAFFFFLMFDFPFAKFELHIRRPIVLLMQCVLFFSRGADAFRWLYGAGLMWSHKNVFISLYYEFSFLIGQQQL